MKILHAEKLRNKRSGFFSEFSGPSRHLQGLSHRRTSNRCIIKYNLKRSTPKFPCFLFYAQPKENLAKAQRATKTVTMSEGRRIGRRQWHPAHILVISHECERLRKNYRNKKLHDSDQIQEAWRSMPRLGSRSCNCSWRSLDMRDAKHQSQPENSKVQELPVTSAICKHVRTSLARDESIH